MVLLRLPLLLAGVVGAVIIWRTAFVRGPAKPDAKAAGLSADKLQRLDDFLQDAVHRRQIAGGVALLARHGRIGHVKAVGWRDLETKTPMTPDALFRIASLTKPITSVAVMMLVEEGKLRLDDPLSKYLPEFHAPKVLALGLSAGTPLPFGGVLGSACHWSYAAPREITIHDLLTHTSGLSYRLWGKKPLSDLYRQAGVSDGLVHSQGTSADNVRRLTQQPLLFSPGSAWEYGLSTDVLGVVVEIVSGQDLATFFRERIFEPLQMRDTFFVVPEEKKDRLASLYLRGANGKLKRVGDKTVMRGELAISANYPCVSDSKYFSGGTGLVSTARDYGRFLLMLQGGGALDGVRLLQPKTVQRMTTNQLGMRKSYLLEYGDSFGYGFGVRTQAGKWDWCSASRWDVSSVGSYSWGGIFNTYFWVDPQKELIGLLMTQLVVGELPLRYEFKMRAYECLAD